MEPLVRFPPTLSGVAQSAEQRTVNPLVESSSLSPGAKPTREVPGNVFNKAPRSSESLRQTGLLMPY